MNKFITDNENKIKTGFLVPEGYFDNFDVKIPSEKIRRKASVIQMFAENKKWILSTAAVLIISLTLIFQWNRKVEESYATEIENQLLYNSTISDDDIVNLLDEEAILSKPPDCKVPALRLSVLLTFKAACKLVLALTATLSAVRPVPETTTLLPVKLS
jgi:hypothetical protein